MPDPQVGEKIGEHFTRSDDFPEASTPARISHGLGMPDMSPVAGNSHPNFTLLPRIANIPPWLK